MVHVVEGTDSSTTAAHALKLADAPNDVAESTCTALASELELKLSIEKNAEIDRYR